MYNATVHLSEYQCYTFRFRSISGKMARTLPWLSEACATKTESKRDRPVKRQRVMDPDSEVDDHNSTGVSIPKRKALLKSGEATMIVD